jgi:hypothetical protein
MVRKLYNLLKLREFIETWCFRLTHGLMGDWNVEDPIFPEPVIPSFQYSNILPAISAEMSEAT